MEFLTITATTKVPETLGAMARARYLVSQEELLEELRERLGEDFKVGLVVKTERKPRKNGSASA